MIFPSNNAWKSCQIGKFVKILLGIPQRIFQFPRSPVFWAR